MTASSLRPRSHANRSGGETTSATLCLARLRHFSAGPGWSQTTMPVRPASLSAATTFDPMNPAAPVTNIIFLYSAADPPLGGPSRLPLPERHARRNAARAGRLDPVIPIAHALGHGPAHAR